MSKIAGTYQEGVFQAVTLLNAVTATTTSSSVPVAGAKAIVMQYTRANHSSGSSAFTVEGTIDGTTWLNLEQLAHDGSKTRAITVTLSANGSALHSIDLENTSVLEVRCKVTETTDGTHTAKALITF